MRKNRQQFPVGQYIAKTLTFKIRVIDINLRTNDTNIVWMIINSYFIQREKIFHNNELFVPSYFFIQDIRDNKMDEGGNKDKYLKIGNRD